MKKIIFSSSRLDWCSSVNENLLRRMDFLLTSIIVSDDGKRFSISVEVVTGADNSWVEDACYWCGYFSRAWLDELPNKDYVQLTIGKDRHNV